MTRRLMAGLILGLTVVPYLFVPSSRAQNDNPFHLPEGVLARLGKGRFGGGDRSVVYSPDGTRLAVATDMGIWLYEARTGAEVALLKGHSKIATSYGWATRAVNSMSFSPDGRKLASGGQDETIRLWDVIKRPGNSPFARPYGSGPIRCRFHRMGGSLASGSSDRTVRLWERSQWSGNGHPTP